MRCLHESEPTRSITAIQKPNEPELTSKHRAALRKGRVIERKRPRARNLLQSCPPTVSSSGQKCLPVIETSICARECEKPKLHMKMSFFASPEVWATLSRPQLADVLAGYCPGMAVLVSGHEVI